MDLIVLEAAAALVLLVLLVWWTMFSGRRGGELDAPDEVDDVPPAQAPGSTGAPDETPLGSRGGNRKLKG